MHKIVSIPEDSTFVGLFLKISFIKYWLFEINKVKRKKYFFIYLKASLLGTFQRNPHLI